MCAPPEVKKWPDPCCRLNESLSNTTQSAGGRFISLDPIGFAGGMNLYSYGNSPVSKVDPEGLRSLVGIFSWSAAKSAAVNYFGTMAISLGLAAGTLGGSLVASILLTAAVAAAGIGLAYSAVKLLTGQWTAEDTAEFTGTLVGGYGGSRLGGSRFSKTPESITPEKLCPGESGPMQGPSPRIHEGRQGKHIPGHNSYRPGRSILTANPNELGRHAGTGQQIGNNPIGSLDSRERVDFLFEIGTYINNEGTFSSPTTNGTIRYSKTGIHTVPARPNQ